VLQWSSQRRAVALVDHRAVDESITAPWDESITAPWDESITAPWDESITAPWELFGVMAGFKADINDSSKFKNRAIALIPFEW